MSQVQPPAQNPAKDNAGRVGDLHRGWQVGEDVLERTTQIRTPCRKTMGQNADRVGIFGDFFADTNITPRPGRYSAERANPPTQGGSGVEGARSGEESARKDGQRRESSAT